MNDLPASLRQLVDAVERRRDARSPPNFTLPPVEANWRLFQPAELQVRRRTGLVSAFAIAFGATTALAAAVGLILTLVNPPQ
jgi:hypothetical protein